jgi:hypothetical protein
MQLLGNFCRFSGFGPGIATVDSATDAQTGLPKNRACLLIMLPRRPEGDLRVAGNRGTLRQRAAIGSIKTSNKIAGQKKWRQTAQTYRTPSLIMFVKPRRH